MNTKNLVQSSVKEIMDLKASGSATPAKIRDIMRKVMDGGGPDAQNQVQAQVAELLRQEPVQVQGNRHKSGS